MIEKPNHVSISKNEHLCPILVKAVRHLAQGLANTGGHLLKAVKMVSDILE
jgi:hypothetical protein